MLLGAGYPGWRQQTLWHTFLKRFSIFLLCGTASLSEANAAASGPTHIEALSPEDKLSSSTAPSLSSQFASGSWGACSALQLARQDFQAVVLRNGSLQGKVLAVGGCCNGASSLASSELYSPSDNSWHALGDLRSPRWLFQAVALPNGSALAIGGLSITKGGVLNSTELFTPASDGTLQGTWSEVAAMNTPRQDFGAVLLDDGTVLAVGGFMASTEIFDPSKDLWTQTSSMSMGDARSAFELVKLSSSKVLAVGGRGRGSGGVLASAEVFDPATKTWQAQGSMAAGRASFAAVAMADGRVLAAGGMSGTGSMLNSSEIFDPKTGDWSQGPEMYYHRALQQAISLPSGRVLMVGGLGGLGDLDTGILDTAEVYDPSTNEWELTDAMVNGRYVFQMVNLPNGTAMAIGGTGLKGFTSSTELFDTS